MGIWWREVCVGVVIVEGGVCRCGYDGGRCVWVWVSGGRCVWVWTWWREVCRCGYDG